MIVEEFSITSVVSVIVGIDPGETTGVCVLELYPLLDSRSLSWRIARGRVWGYEFSVERSGSLLSDEARFVNEIMERLDKLVRYPSFKGGALLDSASVVHLAVEDFVLRERTQDRSLLAPVRLTAGLMALVARSSNSFYVEMQSAADAKSTVTDEVLRASGLYWPGKPHARDAARHAVLYARKHG